MLNNNTNMGNVTASPEAIRDDIMSSILDQLKNMLTNFLKKFQTK